ncbi:MAG TPA: hypothetical protein VGZ73_22515, partial [Bryobacteraceae bacterium]|nr:hypothetical protein [Bryobacteraceae bacterium]
MRRLFSPSRFGLGSALGAAIPQNLGPRRASTVHVRNRVTDWLYVWHPIRFCAPPLAFTKDVNAARTTNFVPNNLILKLL